MQTARELVLTSALFLLALAPVAGAPREVVHGPPPESGDVPAAVALRQFGTRDGLMHSRIYALGQDAGGFVWAGTEAGVERYDGRRWVTMELPGVERGVVPYVNALAGTADGAMWAATDEFGLFRFANGKFAHVPLGGGRAARSLLTLQPRGPDAVYVGGADGIDLCAPGGCRAIDATQGLDVFVLKSDRVDAPRVLWIGTVNDGVRQLVDLDATPRLSDFALTRADGLPSSAIRALALFGGGAQPDLWVGTGEGLARVSDTRVVVYDRKNALDTTTVASLVASRDPRGAPALYAGLRRGGLAEFHEDGRWQRMGTDRELPDDNIISLLATDPERRTPRLWLGSRSSGVLRRDSGLWATISASRLPSGIVLGLGQARFPDGTTRAWIGTADGSVRREAGRWVPLGPAPLDRASVLDAVNGADGALWLASDMGLFRWSARGFDAIDRGPVGLAGDPIIALLPRRDADGAEEIWFGTRHGFGRVRDGRALAPPGEPPALLRQHVVRSFALTASSSGPPVLWVAGEMGLARWDGTRWDDALPAGCLPHREVFDLRVNPHAALPELWVATRVGVTRIALAPQWNCASVGAPRLPGPMSYRIQFDASGRAYVFGYLGATRITPVAGSPTLDDATLDRYDESDGLPALEFNRASMVDALGRVWAGTIAGVAVYDPGDEPQPQGQKPLQLTASVLGSEPRALVEGATLGPERVEVRFDYRLLSFEREHRTRYRTELVGLDEPASAWSAEDSVVYSRLPPGRYEFRLLGRDALGTVSGPVTFRFTIARPWARRWWAIALYAVTIGWIATRLVRWRTRALARRAALLENIVAERTRALAQANDRLVHASLTDPLTGLNNRRYFTEMLAAELQQLAAHAARPLRLLCLVDLDFFKAINDRLGHAAGDAVLQNVATALREAVGADGVAMRWGGEEFLLIVPLESSAQASECAQRLLDSVRAARTTVACEEIPITASLGWALWPWNEQAPDATSLDTVLTLSDQALYRAKAAGRDRAIGALYDPAGAPLPDRPALRVRWVGVP